MEKTNFVQSAKKLSKLMITNYEDAEDEYTRHDYSVDYPKVLEQQYLKTNLGLYRGLFFYYGYLLSHLYDVDIGWNDYDDEPMTTEAQSDKDDKTKQIIWKFLLSPIVQNLATKPTDIIDRQRVYHFIKQPNHHQY